MKNKTVPVGAVELRMRFNQARANHWQAEADALNLRMEKMFRRQLALASKAREYSELAAWERGLVGVAREKGADRMRFENGSVIFLSPKPHCVHGATSKSPKCNLSCGWEVL